MQKTLGEVEESNYITEIWFGGENGQFISTPKGLKIRIPPDFATLLFNRVGLEIKIILQEIEGAEGINHFCIFSGLFFLFFLGYDYGIVVTGMIIGWVIGIIFRMSAPRDLQLLSFGEFWIKSWFIRNALLAFLLIQHVPIFFHAVLIYLAFIFLPTIIMVLEGYLTVVIFKVFKVRFIAYPISTIAEYNFMRRYRIAENRAKLESLLTEKDLQKFVILKVTSDVSQYPTLSKYPEEMLSDSVSKMIDQGFATDIEQALGILEFDLTEQDNLSVGKKRKR